VAACSNNIRAVTPACVGGEQAARLPVLFVDGDLAAGGERQWVITNPILTLLPKVYIMVGVDPWNACDGDNENNAY